MTGSSDEVDEDDRRPGQRRRLQQQFADLHIDVAPVILLHCRVVAQHWWTKVQPTQRTHVLRLHLSSGDLLSDFTGVYNEVAYILRAARVGYKFFIELHADELCFDEWSLTRFCEGLDVGRVCLSFAPPLRDSGRRYMGPPLRLLQRLRLPPRGRPL